jgi:hypothetical protein
VLTLLAAAAVIAGLTGAWSPCGFSMVETLAPHGYAGSRRVSVASCATFALGALAGGVATFEGLALLGSALGAGGTVAAGVAAAIALAAAVGEARGTRIVPQVRRQVPESWRRVLPVPLASGLYGVLLGLGFTTFILTFAVWALAALSVALGDPAAGLAIGLGFGIGRALPVVALAPVAGTEPGSRAHAAMAERPRILRALRALDAAALLACAVALAAGPASAADRVAPSATDPSAAADILAFQLPGGPGMLQRAGGTAQALPGRHPAVGGGHVAWTDGATITVATAGTLAPLASLPVAGADALAVSAGWVAWRAGNALEAVRTDGTGRRRIDAGEVGRPALDGERVVYHRASRSRSELRLLDLATGTAATLRSERRALLLNPSLLGSALLYVRSTATRQQLRLREGEQERVLYSTTPTARRDEGREPGQGRHRHQGRVPELPARPAHGRTDTLWTTAITEQAAYVTRLRALRGGGASAVLLRVGR